MTNHPGRTPGSESPDPALIATARALTGQTQAQAAAQVYAKTRSWEDWEAGRRNMPRSTWELYLASHATRDGALLAVEWERWIRPTLVRELMAVQRKRAAVPLQTY